jgi:hypothetical protein
MDELGQDLGQGQEASEPSRGCIIVGLPRRGRQRRFLALEPVSALRKHEEADVVECCKAAAEVASKVLTDALGQVCCEPVHRRIEYQFKLGGGAAPGMCRPERVTAALYLQQPGCSP